MTDLGWLSGSGLQLLQCCLCRVWLTEDRHEFDGWPHRCKESQSVRARKVPWKPRLSTHG